MVDRTTIRALGLILATLLTACGDDSAEPAGTGDATGGSGATSTGAPTASGPSTPSSSSASAGGSGGDGGGGGASGPGQGGSGGGEPGFSYPAFGGVSFAFGSSPSTVELHWGAALDDTTSAAEMEYRVHVSTVSAEQLALDVEADAPPAMVVTGDTIAELDGLAANQRAWVLVLARDADGELSRNREPTPVSTPSFAPIVARTPKLLEDLDLVIEEIDYDLFDVSGPDVSELSEGDLIIVENTFGRTLREIVELAPAGNTTEMRTARSDLSEVFDQADIRVTYGLVDSPAENIVHREGGLIEVPGPEGMTLDYDVSFEPRLEAEMRWTGSLTDSPEYVRLVASGTLGIEAVIAYELAEEEEEEEEFELFSKTVRFTYAVGGVPVVQSATLKLMAKVTVETSSELSATLTGTGEKTVEVGFEWQPGFDPTLIKNSTSSSETTFELNGEASAKATVSVFPVVSTTLYGVLTGELEVAPEISLDAHARLLPLPAEIDKADLDFTIAAQARADFSVLGKELLKWESDRHELFKLPIHSQPELKLVPPSTATICHPAKAYLQVSNGVGNIVQPAAIDWTVDGGATVTASGNGLTAEIEADEPGTYEVTVSAYGDGPLGPLGRRIATTEIEVVDPGVDCDDVPPPPNEAPASTCGLASDTGLTNPPYFNKARAAVGDPDALLIVPIRVGEQHMLHIGMDMTNHTPNLGPFGAYGFPYDMPRLVENMNEEISFNVGTDRPGAWFPRGVSFGAPGNGSCSGASVGGDEYFQCIGYSAQRVCTDPVAVDAYCTSPPLGYTSTQIIFENEVLSDTCTSESAVIGGPPVIEFVGPDLFPKDPDNDVPAGAQDVSPGQVVRGRLGWPTDRDFYRIRPGGGPYGPAGNGLFDVDPTPEECWVEVDAPSFFEPSPRVAVFRGEDGAENGTNKVAEGIGHARFLPDPTDVYFARIENGALTSYVFEVQSDCTAEVPFPEITADPVWSASTVTPGQIAQLTVEVNALSALVFVDVVDADGNAIAWQLSPSAVTGPATVVLDVQFPVTGFDGATYTPRIRVADTDQEHTSEYAIVEGFSATDFAVKRSDFLESVHNTTQSTFAAPEIVVTD